MPQVLISGTFNEGIRMKRFWPSLKSGREYQEKSESYSCLDMETRPFSSFTTFQTLDYRISKNSQANPCGSFRDNKQGPLNKYAKFH